MGIVLDAAAFDVLDRSEGAALRQLLRVALERGGEVRCAAVTLAEVCRGAARTRRVEAAIARDRGGQRVVVTPTDVRLAKLVGAILHDAGRDSEAIVDAHVVAVCVDFEVAIVISSDPGDIAGLASAVPGTRIVARAPDLRWNSISAA
ncbi:MAG TPA: PIN domain-containing protein [Solirubrobacteraceae bacterium]|nr:PIN domain-containing protein [Solirubrobacteraceae bacterium]